MLVYRAYRYEYDLVSEEKRLTRIDNLDYKSIEQAVSRAFVSNYGEVLILPVLIGEMVNPNFPIEFE